MSGTIYTIRHVPSGRCYVGATRNIKRRWQNHHTWLRAGRHANKSLQEAFDTDGVGSLEFSVVETGITEIHSLRQREKRLITHLSDVFNVKGLGPTRHVITASLSDPQTAWLKAEAERMGITLGELLRRIIDQSRLEIRSPQ